MNKPLRCLVLFVLVAIALSQIYLGYLGFEFVSGHRMWVAVIVTVLSLGLKFMLPFTVGVYIFLHEALGIAAWQAALIAAPGLLLLIPSLRRMVWPSKKKPDQAKAP